jgi:anthranilate/para-aminobenzoate synthase component II
MIHVLIIALFHLNTYNTFIEKNLDYFKIEHTTVLYDMFDSIDFKKYTHIILSGSDYFIMKNQIVLSKIQVLKIIYSNLPVLAQCYAFHLLAYHLSGYDSVKVFHTKRTNNINIQSPLVKKDSLYYVNHINYVDYLDHNWKVISKKTILDGDGSRKTFIMDAMMKDFPVLCIQYHPEATITNYDFYYQWITHSHEL